MNMNNSFKSSRIRERYAWGCNLDEGNEAILCRWGNVAMPLAADSGFNYLSSKNNGFALICVSLLLLVSKIHFGFQFRIRWNNTSPVFSTVSNYITQTIFMGQLPEDPRKKTVLGRLGKQTTKGPPVVVSLPFSPPAWTGCSWKPTCEL